MSEETPLSKLPNPQQELLWTLASSVLGLLTSLSEAQDEIVEAISNIPEIVGFLFLVLTSDLRLAILSISSTSYDS